jgi:hypothetical protein
MEGPAAKPTVRRPMPTAKTTLHPAYAIRSQNRKALAFCLAIRRPHLSRYTLPSELTVGGRLWQPTHNFRVTPRAGTFCFFTNIITVTAAVA